MRPLLTLLAFTLGCAAQPQADCASAERAGLLWTGQRTQDELLRDYNANPDGYVGRDASTGCLTID